MLTVTPEAVRQIRQSARHGDMEELALRIAPARNADNTIAYRMGFDEAGPGDLLIHSNGIDVVIATEAKVLLNGLVLDFVEIHPGEHRFIFMNPNDPGYVPPDQ